MNPDGSVWITQGPGWGFVMAGDDAIWAIYQEGVASRSIVYIDPETNTTEVAVPDLPVLPNPITAVGVNDSIWVASWDRSSVTRYEGETGELIEETDVGLHPVEPVYAYGDVWTTSIHGNTVTRFDTETGDAQTIEMDPPGSPITMQVIRDDLAIVGNPGGMPYLINPETMTVVGQFDAGLGPDCLPTFPAESRIAAVDGALWVAGCSDEGLTIMDPDTGEILGEVVSPVTADPPFVIGDVKWLPFDEQSPLTEPSWPIDHGWLGLRFEDGVVSEDGVVGMYQPPSRFTEGYYAIAFDSIWMFGHEGILRIPAGTLQAVSE